MKRGQRRKSEPVKVAAPELQKLLDEAKDAYKARDKEALQKASAAIAAEINFPLDGEKTRLRYKVVSDDGKPWDGHMDIGASIDGIAEFISDRYQTWSETYTNIGQADKSTERIIGVEWKRYPKREIEPYKPEIVASNVYDDDENPVDIWNDWK